MTEPFCASSPTARSMSDEDFWAHVYNRPGPYYDVEEVEIEFCVGFCLRCGEGLFAEDYQQLRIIIDEDRELCDDCADALLPDIEETW